MRRKDVFFCVALLRHYINEALIRKKEPSKSIYNRRNLLQRFLFYMDDGGLESQIGDGE